MVDTERTTAVRINGLVYHVRSNDPEHVTRLAQYVDERMRRLSTDTPTVDSLKIAVLTALHISDDLFSARRELEAMEQRSGELVEMLEPFRSPDNTDSSNMG